MDTRNAQLAAIVRTLATFKRTIQNLLNLGAMNDLSRLVGRARKNTKNLLQR
jgi:hypothetical protein